jgi:hypothetical protein
MPALFGHIEFLTSMFVCFVGVGVSGQIANIVSSEGLSVQIPVSLLGVPFFTMGFSNLWYLYPEYILVLSPSHQQRHLEGFHCYYLLFGKLDVFGTQDGRITRIARQKPHLTSPSGMCKYQLHISVDLQGVASLLVCFPPAAEPVRTLISLIAVNGLIVG